MVLLMLSTMDEKKDFLAGNGSGGGVDGLNLLGLSLEVVGGSGGMSEMSDASDVSSPACEEYIPLDPGTLS